MHTYYVFLGPWFNIIENLLTSSNLGLKLHLIISQKNEFGHYFYNDELHKKCAFLYSSIFIRNLNAIRTSIDHSTLAFAI